MKRLLWAVAFALAAAVPAVAARTGPSYGVADDAPKYAADGGDRYFAMLSGDLGMSEDRITVYWDAGQPSTIQEKTFLDRSVARAAAHGVQVVFTVYPKDARTFSSDVANRAQEFAVYLKLLVGEYRDAKKYIVLNEPNEAFFLSPQRGPSGRFVSAPEAYTVLSAAYDALHPLGRTVVGLGLSPEANDVTSTSPVRFLKALGDAYRASGRTTPLMDELGFHLYPRDASREDGATHYHWPNAGAADLDRIKQAFWDAFHGTGQPVFQETARAVGPVVRLSLDEIGWQVAVLPGLAALYENAENTPVTTEARQAAIYAALIPKLSCDVTVSEILLFHLIDEVDLRRFQSGLLRADGSKRPSFDTVRTAIADAKAGCGRPVVWHHQESLLGGAAYFDSTRRYPADRGIFGLSVAASEEANAVGAIVRAGGPSGVLRAKAIEQELRLGAGSDLTAISRKLVKAYFKPRLEFAGAQKRGWYRYAVLLTAAMNPNRHLFELSEPFRVG